MKDLLIMEPVYKDYIWGGNKLKTKFNKDTLYDITAESWEISANKNGICYILNKEFDGKNLEELYSDTTVREEIFGKRCLNIFEFPLLIKFIDANENLSVQVHPDREYVKKNKYSKSKDEFWYVMDCDNDANVIAGLKKDVDKKIFKEAIDNKKVEECLNYIPVKKGDSIYLKAGTVHSVLGGTIICEIEQNADDTFRIYDWDRKDIFGNRRELKINEAIEALREDIKVEVKHENENEVKRKLVSNDFYTVEEINCKSIYEDKSNENTFYAITIVDGTGIIEYNGKEKFIKYGDSFIIPATFGEYKITGDLKLLKTYIN